MKIADLYGSKVLGVFAHADDEIVAGWPIFQDREIDRSLVIIVDDVSRKGQGRLKALIEVCRTFDINLVIAGNIETEFYRLPTRYADFVLVDALRLIRSMITQAFLTVKPDYIMTHNPVGEYGHGDHRLLFDVVTQIAHADVLYTDLCEENACHRSSKDLPDSVVMAYYDRHSFIEDIQMQDFYAQGMEIYRKYNAWTWKYVIPDVKKCNLYIL